MVELETIEILSRNKIAWLRAKGIQETDKRIIKKKGKVFVAYVYPATEEVEDALMEYKYNSDIQEFIRKFREINNEIYCCLMEGVRCI